MIPKVIHYCWFGRGPKSEIIQKCMASWREFCPDYEIIEWNEDNFDVNSIPYTAAAYADKKWAFVSDYARLKVVYDHGGIYLDTDVLLHSSLDELLSYDCWLASDDVRYVATGLGFGAEQKNFVIEYIMRGYESYSFPADACVKLDTPRLQDILPDWKKSLDSQVIGQTLIVGKNDYSKYAKHLYTNTGVFLTADHVKYREMVILAQFNGESIYTLRDKLRWKIGEVLRKPVVIRFIDNHKDKIYAKILTFLIFDMVDCGLVYFLKRAISKIKKR